MDATHETLAELLSEEEATQFSTFDNQMAWRIGSRLVALATEQGLPVTIDINRNGQQLFHAALPGTSADNDEWIKRKNRVVNRFGHSSLYIGARYRSQGTTFEEKSRLNLDEYARTAAPSPSASQGLAWSARSSQHHRRRQDQFDPRQPDPWQRAMHRHPGQHVAHRNRQHRSRQGQTDPETSCHFSEFWVFFRLRRDGARFQRHATDRTTPRSRTHNLRVHGAGIFRS